MSMLITIRNGRIEYIFSDEWDEEIFVIDHDDGNRVYIHPVSLRDPETIERFVREGLD